MGKGIPAAQLFKELDALRAFKAKVGRAFGDETADWEHLLDTLLYLADENKRIKRLALALAERVADQNELLTRRACRE